MKLQSFWFVNFTKILKKIFFEDFSKQNWIGIWRSWKHFHCFSRKTLQIFQLRSIWKTHSKSEVTRMKKKSQLEDFLMNHKLELSLEAIKRNQARSREKSHIIPLKTSAMPCSVIKLNGLQWRSFYDVIFMVHTRMFSSPRH